MTRIIDLVFARLAPANMDAELAALETELGEVQAPIAQLKRAIERVPDLEPDECSFPRPGAGAS